MAHELLAVDLLAEVRTDHTTANRGEQVVTPSELWSYVRRGPQAPSSLVIERALRSSDKLLRRYHRMRASLEIATSPQAMAANTGKYPDRQIGKYRLRTVEEDDAMFVVISGPEGDDIFPTILEAESAEERVRIGLPQPIRGHVQLKAAGKDSDMIRLMVLLESPKTSLSLLP